MNVDVIEKAKAAKKEYYRQWRAKNREHLKEYYAKWRKNNPDKVKRHNEAIRKWQREHPERVKEYQANYWIRKAQAAATATETGKEAV